MKNPNITKHNHNLFFATFGLILIFLILAISAYSNAFFDLDLRFSRYLQSFQNPTFSFVMNFVSEIGDGFKLELIVGSLALILFYTGNTIGAFSITASPLIAAFVGSYMKKIIGRPRPGSDLVTIQELLKDKSFPSLHVILFTVIFGYIIYLAFHNIKNYWLKNIIILSSSFLILTIGLSRIYLGAHWASDTVGGYVLGALILLFTIGLNKRNDKNAKR